MSDFSMHDHIDLEDFELAQKHAAIRGCDPYNSADAVWDWHDRIVADNDYVPDVNVFGEAPSSLGEYDANRGLSMLLRRQAG